MRIDESELTAEAKRDGIERIVVGAIVVRPGTREGVPSILLLDRVPDDFLGGIEEFPSGKVEAGESLISALERELFEETGIKILSVSGYAFNFDYNSASGRRSRQFNFIVQVSSDHVTLNPTEHVGYRWVRLDALSMTRLTENVIQLLSDLDYEIFT